MKTSVIAKDDERYSILFEDVSPEFMNLLRRTIGFETPTIAIEDVHFTENSSALYDEMIAHRIGLIPIRVKNVDDYKFQDSCLCKGKGCKNCQIVISLKVEGPKWVYAQELVSKEKGLDVLYPETPIVKLSKGQKIELKAVATLGVGKEHVKWSPALAYYSNYTTAKVGGKAVKPKDPVEFSRRLLDMGEGALKTEGIKGKADIVTADDKFIFTIESWGQRTPKELLQASVKVIKAKVNDLKVK